MQIKVLGPGCANCEKALKIIEEAVADSGVHADVGKVTDLMEIAGHGVFGTPAVVIDGEVKCVGKVPSKDEVMSWLSQYTKGEGPCA